MPIADLDHHLLVWARTHGHSPAAERGVAAFSALGEHAAWLRGAGMVTLAYAVNTVLKLIVRRPRPALDGLPALIATPTDLGFPSAHATTGFAAARRYAALAPGVPLYAAATGLAASRVYLGVHHPSDVVAGAALGTLIAGGPPWR